MKSVRLAASAVLAVSVWLPGQIGISQAAQPAAPAGAPAAPLPAATDDAITFDQYRDWRLRYIEQRQTQLTAQLAAADLQPRQRARLEQIKAYYDWFAGLSAADRDRRFRERFDQIDANHDGIIDHAERAAWHEKQRAFYGRGRTASAEPAAEREPR
ncbi:MAG: hypothetical protein JO058_03740 [Alphaproteobacteria bacterium]|nr:hypothetical protein [Alphaproteobacteria bacterium]